VPQAILLYSLTEAHCSLNGTFQYTSILTMTSTNDAQMLLTLINSANSPPAGVIQDGMTSGSGNGGNNSSATSAGSPAPTTAVAMSILYSITGIITLLFITIIATGAVRAHRHPERYGPRRAGLPGRPRQSRAKGIARAMLETLPIVKFGDPEPAKPGSTADVELENGRSVTPVNNETDATGSKKAEDAANGTRGVAAAATIPEGGNGSGLGPDIQDLPAAGSREHLAEEASHLGCSICTEDFEKGEDVRVLPCNHKYHPACVDPWLLNVSGTCPLW
jgi:hypothetical protein